MRLRPWRPVGRQPMIEAPEGFDPRGVATRKARFLDAFADSPTLAAALAKVLERNQTVYRWRDSDPDFAVAYMRIERDRARGKQNSRIIRFDPFREMPPVPDLVDFRRLVFGFPSTGTQEAFAKAWDDKTNLWIFWEAPAGAGKDVTVMQAVAQAAAKGLDKMGCVMENERQAKKRIDSYLDPYFTDHSVYTRAPDIPGGTKPEIDFIDAWGPWKHDSRLRLPDGTKPPATKWDAYHKWFVGRTTPQADPSLWALGIESSIAGSRQQLLVMSDLFTTENQRSATFRKDQFEAITGTLDARLDARGRLVVLNHHVRQRGESNLVRMEEQYVGTARVVRRDGDYTKYANGVAVVRTPALRVEDGILISYWPDMFPVEAELELPDGTRVPAAGLSDAEHDELQAKGARRIRGLTDRRDTTPELFQLHYQQNPESQGFGDFTQEALEAAFDDTRTLGVSLPTETLILSVDPARQGGCAWTVLGLDLQSGVTTLIDFWIGERLGFTGMREKLIKLPVELYRPVDMVWEDNYEGETPEHPEAREVLTRYHVRYVPWHTLTNRSEGDYAVMKMRDDMNRGLIRFPGATPADRMRCQDLFDHFRNFEQVGYTERKHASGARRLHDDGCLAFWMGWAHGKVLSRVHKRREKRVSMVPDAIRNAFSGYKVT